MFADLTDVRCYYELLGTGAPLLLIPGLGATCTLWDGVTSDLSKSFSLILLDNRGLGRSIAKRAPQNLADLGADLVELLDHLQVERAHVLGLSLGGIIAQQLTIDHPSRVDRLVLVSCSNRFGPYLLEVAKLIGQSLRHFPPELFRRVIELLGTSPEYFDAHADEIDQKISTECDLGISRGALARQLRCLGCQDLADEQHYHITAPTMVIAGEQDMLIPACYAKQMARQIPGSEFLLVRGCGHNPFTEKPEQVVPRIVEFLMRRRARDSRDAEEAQLATEETV